MSKVEVVRFKCPKCGKRLSVTQSTAVVVVSVLCAACSTVSYLTQDDPNGKPPSEPPQKPPRTEDK